LKLKPNQLFFTIIFLILHKQTEKKLEILYFNYLDVFIISVVLDFVYENSQHARCSFQIIKKETYDVCNSI